MIQLRTPSKGPTTAPTPGRHLYGLIMVFATLFFFDAPRGTAEAYQCGACNRSTCAVPPDCTGGLVVDQCGCCRVCAKLEDSECGGNHGLKGRCAQGLYCAINPEPGQTITGHEEGICRSIPHPPLPLCQHVSCNIVFERPCPADSIPVGGTVPPGECCPEPFHCECMQCLDSGPLCEENQIRRMTELGIGQTGQCCDVYECIDKDDTCEHVVCEEDPYANATCPDDSVALSPLITQNGCCTQHAGCICQPPDQCHIPHCDPGTRPQLVNPMTGQPGRCCDVIECVSDSVSRCPAGRGMWREDGETWNLDECLECECSGGVTQCNHLQCDMIESCGWISIPPGECCHKCMGCTKGNMTYVNGAEWQQDDCVTCYCEDGQVYCRAELCLVQCPNPITIPGRCCPSCQDDAFFTPPKNCPNLDNCTLAPFCPLGLVEDDYGCYECACKDDVIIGTIPELCELECIQGYVTDSNGIEICECLPQPTTTLSTTTKTSQQERHPTSAISTDILPPDDSSEAEKISPAHGIFCPSIHTCEKECAFGYRVTREGCPRCKCNRCPAFICQKKCVHGYAYNDNGCVLCKCKDNNTQQPDEDVSMPTMRPLDGETCMTDDGRLYEEGQSWHDGCRLCFCHQARELCTLITCPVPRCRHPIVQAGDCCAICPDETTMYTIAKTTSCRAAGGRHIAEGETWRLNECSLCICHDGEMMCEAERCPPLTCHRPVRLTHHCCPVCLEDDLPPATLPSSTPGGLCQVAPGMIFHSGDVWRVSACQSCMCRDGQILCFAQTCPLLTKCHKTVVRKGQCCPLCVEEELGPPTCLMSGETYSSGERWFLNNCTVCLCYNGGTLCRETQCSPLVSCAVSVTLPDTCCPICINQTLVTPGGHDPSRKGEGSSTAYVVIIIVLVLAVLCLVVIVAVLCWRKRRRQQQERDRRVKAVQAMLQQSPGRLDRRPKSVNLEYRGGNPLYRDRLNRFDYQEPNKCSLYDETEVLLADKVKCLDAESRIVPSERSIAVCKNSDGLNPVPVTNNLNEFHSVSVEDNYNISCGSEHTLTKPYLGSCNDLTCDMDKLSEFDNAACIESLSSDFDVSKSEEPSSLEAQMYDSRATDDANQSTLLNCEMVGDNSQIPIVSNIPTRGQHRPPDKHVRYSVNDDVWLRNSSKQGDKAPMGDKFIRYSVGAEPPSNTHEPVSLVVPPICDSVSYRKSL